MTKKPPPTWSSSSPFPVGLGTEFETIGKWFSQIDPLIFADKFQVTLTPHKALLVALLEDAFYTLMKQSRGNIISRRTHFETLRWFENRAVGVDWRTGITFEYVCGQLELNAEV